jgi:hypothetical protein
MNISNTFTLKSPKKTMHIIRLSCCGKGVIQQRSMHYAQRTCTFTFKGALETAVKDSRMYSPQNGALETGLSALALHWNEDELL